MAEKVAEEIAAKAATDATKDEKTEEAKDAGNGTDKTEAAPDPTEASARAKGWKPQDEYKGDRPWVDAKTFLDREPLIERISGQSKTIAELKRTVDAMAKHVTASIQHGVKVELDKLNAAKKEAIKEGDVDKVEAIDKQIDQAKETKADIPTAPDIAPEVADWVKENPWYTKDAELHDFALAFNDSYLKRHPGDLSGSLEATMNATKRAFPEKFAKADSGNGKDDGERKRTPAGSVEGSTSSHKGGVKYSTSRLNTDQKLVHDQYIKAGTFKKLAEAAKMSESEYYMRQLEDIGELTK